MQSTTDQKKVKKKFKTKKSSITCSKLMIDELPGSPTRSENAYFVNNEQASIAVFTTALFYTCRTSFSQLKLYNN